MTVNQVVAGSNPARGAMPEPMEAVDINLNEIQRERENKMPEIQSDEPNDLGHGHVWVFDSSSRPNTSHVTVLGDDNSWFCSCEGFRFRSWCKHIDYVKSNKRNPHTGRRFIEDDPNTFQIVTD